MGKRQQIKQSFQKQGLMQHLDAELVEIVDGQVVIQCPLSEKVTQQQGFFHAGAITSIVDSACGYGALSTMPEGSEVLSVEFKVNLLRPATGPFIRATGRVLKAGRTLTVCEGEVHDAKGKLVSKMIATMIGVPLKE